MKSNAGIQQNSVSESSVKINAYEDTSGKKQNLHTNAIAEKIGITDKTSKNTENNSIWDFQTEDNSHHKLIFDYPGWKR